MSVMRRPTHAAGESWSKWDGMTPTWAPSWSAVLYRFLVRCRWAFEQIAFFAYCIAAGLAFGWVWMTVVPGLVAEWLR